jgi:hypothetical protein
MTGPSVPRIDPNATGATATTLAGAVVLTAGAMCLAAPATAAPIGGRADDAVNTLQTQGYTVQINGSQSAPLSACTVTNVSGSSGSAVAAGPAATAYVDVACPQGC